jgi:hypothetical protein
VKRIVVVVALAVGAAAVASAATPLPWKARLIERGDFAGFAPETKTTSYTTAKSWVAGDTRPSQTMAAAQVARLHREGFERVVVEFLDHGAAKQHGVSWAMRLGSNASARAELAATLRDEKQLRGSATFTTFADPQVPGARGYRTLGSGFSGDNVLFADGPYLYLLGQGWGSSEKEPPRAALFAAVRTLYARVHGR